MRARHDARMIARLNASLDRIASWLNASLDREALRHDVSKGDRGDQQGIEGARHRGGENTRTRKLGGLVNLIIKTYQR